jgi:hypothetical protein
VPDLEERLRTAVMRRSEGFEPSADLPERIGARVRRRRRARQLLRGGVAAAAAAAAVLTVVVAVPDRPDGASLQTTNPDDPDVQEGDDPSHPTTTWPTVPKDGSTSTSSTTSTTVAPPVPTGPAVPSLSRLTRQGVGPITAGMTLRQAQEAAGVAVTPTAGGSSTCIEAEVQGLEMTGLVLVVEPAPPGADVMDGIVRATAGSILDTEEGVIVGQTRDEVLAILGQPTRTEDQSVELAPASAELLVFEADGYAYGVVLLDGQVYGVQSGDPGWIDDVDGCP